MDTAIFDSRAQTDNTKILLKEIAKHLSYRDGTKDMTYMVFILRDSLFMSPNLLCYADKSHRKCTDKKSVLAHVCEDHLVNCYESSYKDSVLTQPDYFVQGIYIYSRNNSLRRKWRKLDMKKGQENV